MNKPDSERLPLACGRGAWRLVLALLLATAAGAVTACGDKDAGATPVPPEVSVMSVEPRTIDADYEFVGQAAASKSVEVRSQLNGIIVERPYAEGTDVEKGAVLFRLDATTYEATYRSAEARVASAQARFDNAKRNLARLRPLLAERAVAQKDVDDAETEEASAQAALDDAKAVLDKAKKDYDDTWIRAEIPGRVGLAQLVLGARVAGPADILTVVDQIDPIYVYFSPSDQELLRWRSDLAENRITVPPGTLEVSVKLSDGSTFPYKGRLNFADLTLQPGTGTLQLRAELKNPQRTLLPGQFVRVHILGVKRNNAILVPQRAVLQGIGGSYVYVVAPDGQAVARDVVTAAAIGDHWLIEKGLQAGDRVITEGTQKVVAGRPVRVAAAGQAGAPDSVSGTK